MVTKKRVNEGYTVICSSLHAAILLMNLIKAKHHPEIGHVDLDKSFDDIYRELNKTTTWIPSSILERGLWAANMLQEIGEFVNPTDSQSFEAFVKDLLRDNYEFNSATNLVTKKDEEDND
jgi:hypothetical protein